jgi:hypothetical protein
MLNPVWFDPHSSGITLFNPAALRLFEQARRAARQRQFLSWWLRRSRQLVTLEASFTPTTAAIMPPVAHLPITAIQGSVNRSEDFDCDFLPLKDTLATRWVRIASMLLQGATLPPVVLLLAHETYYVLDGHHRLSVYRLLGQSDVDVVLQTTI